LSCCGLDIEAQRSFDQLEKLGFDMVARRCHDLPYRQHSTRLFAGELLEHCRTPACFSSAAPALSNLGGACVINPNVFTPMLYLMYLKNWRSGFQSDHAM